MRGVWNSRLFQLYVAGAVIWGSTSAYIGPTITKHIGMQWSARTIALMSTIGMVIGLLQTPVAKWISPRVIMWFDAIVCIPAGIMILVGNGSSLAAGLICYQVTRFLYTILGNNADALMWEALGKVGEQSQMRTRIGSLFCAVGLVFGSLAIAIPPPSVSFCFWVSGISSLLHFPLCVWSTQETLRILKEHG